MDHYKVFKLCKSVYAFIQVTIDDIKKRNNIRYQIIDLSIDRDETSSLYKDVK